MSREVRSVLMDLRDGMAMKAFEKDEDFVPGLVFPFHREENQPRIESLRTQIKYSHDQCGIRRILR
jgi:hypothetical protein